MNNWKVGKYIVKENRKTNYPTLVKIQIVDVTELTIKTKNLDGNGHIGNSRYLKELFNKDWIILEQLEDYYQNLSIETTDESIIIKS